MAFLEEEELTEDMKEKLIEKVIVYPENRIEIVWKFGGHDTNLCRVRAEMAPDMGIDIYGEMDEFGTVKPEYYVPYLSSHDMSSEADCSIQRHTEKETYAGLLDEYRVGISLIFYLENLMEYQERTIGKESAEVSCVNLTGLCVSGKILLPLKKNNNQTEMAKVASKERNSLLEAAKNGDEDAMELTGTNRSRT